MTNLNSTIEALAHVGNKISRDQTVDTKELDTIQFQGAINRQSPDFWQLALDDLTDDKVADVIRGLTFVEGYFRWTGGSVAATIWAFRILVERNCDATFLDELSSWILKNTNNPYNPFGTIVILGARNYSQYCSLKEVHSERIQHYIQAQKEQEITAEEARVIRRARAAKGASDRKTAIRDEVIAQLDVLSIGEKLQAIAMHESYPPQFFPITIANLATQEVIEELPDKVRFELAHRLKGRRRGAWGKFKKRLHLSLRQGWNQNQPFV